MSTTQCLNIDDKTLLSSAELSLETPRMLHIFTFIMATLLAISIGALFLPWQQSSIGTGRVIAYAPDDRVQNLESPVEGRIAKWYVVEGSKVMPGDPIVEINDIDPMILDRLQSELTAGEQKLEAIQKAVEVSKRNVERQRSLATQGLSSQRAYELAELEYSKLLSELSSATAEFAKTQVRLARQSTQVVKAPREGTIHRVFVTQGSAVVHLGDVLATLVPDSDSRAVELLIDGNDVPLISVGRAVRIQFEGWPAVQFVGWPSVAVGTFPGTVAVVDPTDDGSGRFRVIVFPAEGEERWPDGRFLRQGIRAQGWILLDQVKLAYELWRRFNGFPQSITQPEKEGASGKKSEEKPKPLVKKKGEK